MRYLLMLLAALMMVFPAQAQQPIRATLSGPSRSLAPDMFCYNVNTLGGLSLESPQFREMIRVIQPGALRLPGGTVSNFWDWRVGWVVDEAPLADAWLNHTPHDLNLFAASLNATNTTPIFVLNMLTDELDSQLEMLQTAQRMGLPVRYVELGHEYHTPTTYYLERFPTAQDYADEAAEWHAAIRTAFPGVQVSAVGDWQSTAWNGTVQETVGAGLSMHPYVMLLFPEATVSQQLGMPFAAWETLQRDILASLPPEVPLWFTDYGFLEVPSETRLAGTWGEGLFTVTQSLLYLQEPRVQVLCPTSPTAGSAPLLAALRLLGNAITGQTNAQEIRLQDTPMVEDERGRRYPALIGWTFGQQQTGLFINLSGQALTIELTDVWRSAVNIEQVWGDPTVPAPDLQHQIGSVTGRLTLPPFSITRLWR